MRDSLLKNSVAGSWYSGDAAQLATEIHSWQARAKTPVSDMVDSKLFAIIVPHAGYTYSGPTAAYAYKLLKGKAVKRVILLAPSHRVFLKDCAVIPESKGTVTPFGPVNFDSGAAEVLLQSPLFSSNDRVHDGEHSTQIQYPFLQDALGADVKILPVIVGILSPDSAQNIADAIRPLLDESTLLVISSDFIHFGSDFDYVPFRKNTIAECEKINRQVWKIMKSGSVNDLFEFMERTGATICGINPIFVLMNLLPHGFDAELLHYASSADSDDDPDSSRFVCYLAGAFRVRNERLSRIDKKTLLAIAHDAIAYVYEHRKAPPADYFDDRATENTKLHMGAFVTLNNPDGSLRGCIGEIEPYRALYRAVAARAVDAAFRDPRFTQLQPSEFQRVKIEISALTPAKPVASWRDIVIGKHGMTLEKNGRAAVFLPQVAPEQGWDIVQTLTQLSLKAGLPADAWKDGASFTVFEALVFSMDVL